MPNVPNTQPAIMKPTEEHPAYTQITKVSPLTVQTDSGIHPPLRCAGRTVNSVLPLVSVHKATTGTVIEW